MDGKLKLLADNTRDLFLYLKSKYHLLHLSNVFFRDLQYGLMSYFESKGVKLGYGEAEEITKRFVELLEGSDILKPIKNGSWMLNYPDFKKPSAKPEAPAKSVAASLPRTATGSAATQQIGGAALSTLGQASPGNSNPGQSIG
jgi:hypothetical protein